LLRPPAFRVPLVDPCVASTGILARAMVSRAKSVIVSARGKSAGIAGQAARAVVSKRKRATPAKFRLTNAGQHFASSGLCIATSKKGKPCCDPVHEPGVPFCKRCMVSGDPALKVRGHPRAGKILVAARDLPAGYKVPLWGRLTKKRDMTEKAMEWGFDLSTGWFLDPTKCPGSLVQFCPCPGPNEVAVITGQPRCATTDKRRQYGAWTFLLTRPVKRDFQITLQYGVNSKDSDAFFAERGIVRLDVGTKANPAYRRKDATRA